MHKPAIFRKPGFEIVKPGVCFRCGSVGFPGFIRCGFCYRCGSCHSFPSGFRCVRSVPSGFRCGFRYGFRSRSRHDGFCDRLGCVCGFRSFRYGFRCGFPSGFRYGIGYFSTGVF
jgi:hypothetical protein